MRFKLIRVAVVNGQSIALLRMALGPHTFVASAADNAGNSATLPVTFRIVATIETLMTTIDLFLADHSIADSGTGNGLLAKLTDAKDARDSGRNTVAVNKLNDFIDQVRAREGTRISPAVARILVADAQYGDRYPPVRSRTDVAVSLISLLVFPNAHQRSRGSS